MSRFRFLVIAAAILASAITGRVVQQTMAADEVVKVDVSAAKPNRPITLRDRLIVGLQARLKSEVAFVDAVVVNVVNGHIPQQKVDETFYWARQRVTLARDGRHHRPIIYFEPAMRARAKLLNVTL